MDHQFGELQNFKEQMGRGGGKQNSLAGEAGLVEVAWDRNPWENKQLQRQSPQENQCTHPDHKAYVDKLQSEARVILGEFSVTNGSDVIEQRPARGGSMRPPQSCSQAYLSMR